jgi:hypothetical protein
VTDAVQIAITVAIPPTVAAIGAIVATILVDRRADRKLNHITVLTNSTLTAANKRIDELEELVRSLLAERQI